MSYNGSVLDCLSHGYGHCVLFLGKTLCAYCNVRFLAILHAFGMNMKLSAGARVNGRTDLVGEKLDRAQVCCTAHVTYRPEVHGRCFLSVEQRKSNNHGQK